MDCHQGRNGVSAPRLKRKGPHGAGQLFGGMTATMKGTTMDIEQIKRDQEAGTPGPWRENTDGEVCMDHNVAAWICAVNYDCTTDQQADADMRRIVRLPDLEDAYIAAAAERDALAENLARAVEVLATYATQVEEYTSDNPVFSDCAYDWLNDDAGQLARTTLAAIKEGGE